MALMIIVPGKNQVKYNDQKLGYTGEKARNDISLNKRRLNKRIRQSAQQEYTQR